MRNAGRYISILVTGALLVLVCCSAPAPVEYENYPVLPEPCKYRDHCGGEDPYPDRSSVQIEPDTAEVA